MQQVGEIETIPASLQSRNWGFLDAVVLEQTVETIHKHASSRLLGMGVWEKNKA